MINESRLSALFDYQKFEGNPRLAKLISATENAVKPSEARALSDDEIDVWAAGDFGALKAQIFDTICRNGRDGSNE